MMSNTTIPMESLSKRVTSHVLGCGKDMSDKDLAKGLAVLAVSIALTLGVIRWAETHPPFDHFRVTDKQIQILMDRSVGASYHLDSLEMAMTYQVEKLKDRLDVIEKRVTELENR